MSEGSEGGSEYQGSSDSEADFPASVRETSQSAPESHIEDDNGAIKFKPARKTFRLRKQELKRRSKQYRSAGHYSNSYRELLNDSILEANGQQVDAGYNVEAPSTVGVTLWTSAEKAVSYSRLATLGRHDIRGISAAIGTKAESEVNEYILLSQEGVVEDSVTGRERFESADAVPAAEVSKECESALDLAAEALAWQQEKSEAKRELKRHGDYWLSTQDIATKIEEPSRVKEDVHVDTGADHVLTTTQEDGSEPQLPVPAASLLNLPTWLQLSKLFMNGTQAEGGWSSLIEDENETPSMYRTAFEDFHNLAISLTKRLIQASIFQAMSRMRATRSTAPNVRPIDVHTAAQVLSSKDDWHNFWARAARRNHLKVYSQAERFDDGREKTQFGCLLSYDEVEAECGLATEKPEGPVGDVVPTVEEDLDSNNLLEDDDIWTEASYSGSSDDAAVDGDKALADENSAHGSDYAPETPDYETEAEPHTQNSRRHRHVLNPRVLEKRQDMYTEASDQQMSAAEEQRLWAVSGREPPFHVKAEEAETPRPPSQRRKRRAEVEDWKDRIDFQAEWERFGETVPKEEFESVGQRGVQGRKRRRVAYDTSQQRGFDQGGQDTMDDHEMGADQDTEQVAGG